MRTYHRMAAARREARANATHCEKGHELSEANSFRSGHRKGCRTCRREGNFWWQRAMAEAGAA